MKNDEEDSNFLNILSLNVRSTSSIDKFNEFRGMVLKLKCILAIIAVQETWFNEGNIKLYRIEGFSLINCCRDDEYGGTTVYIREDIKYGIINNQSHDFVDVMMFCCRITLINNKPLIIYSVHRLQKCSFYKFISKLESLLLGVNNSPCLFMGDLNINLLCLNNRRNCLLDNFTSVNIVSCHNLVTRPVGRFRIDCVFSKINEMITVNSIENNRL